jgi:hypothetical protein
MAESKKIGLNKAQSKVYAALRFDYLQSKNEFDSEQDEVSKKVYKAKMDSAEKSLNTYLSGGKPDAVVLTLPNNEQYIYSFETLNSIINEGGEMLNQIVSGEVSVGLLSDKSNPKAKELSDKLTKLKQDAVQVETTGQVPVQPEATVGEEVEQGKPQPEAEVVTEEGVKAEEVTPAQEVEQLRAKEQAELKAAIPNADQYLTDGKVDEKKLTNDKDKEAFNEIWERYNVLITPNLPKEVVKTEEVNPIIESIANLKLDENNLESVIEELEFIDDAKRKAARSSTSSKTKAKLNADIAQYEANIADKPNEVKIAKTINDNFDKIKKDLKEQGLLNVKC